MRRKKVRFTNVDLTLVLLLFLAGGWLIWRAHVALDHDWDWSAIPGYLIRQNPETGAWGLGLLGMGFVTTIRLSLWSMTLALILGTIVGLARSGRGLAKRLLAATYVEGVRNVPPLVLVFIFYFILSDQILPLLGLDRLLNPSSETGRAMLTLFFAPPEQAQAFLAAVITLSLFEAAYIAEIVRGGIQSVDRGQWEASAALGMGPLRQMTLIVLPQAVPRILPPLAGQFVSTIKDSAIVSVISIRDLTFQGTEIMAATFLTFEVWLTVTALY
ncbi:MAG: amino acid ABC transporter permease, partial [Deltaproteobacteria bacterium]|nr:amino acid ABC transporter permease [Deltaproteobacteria bacterium]